MNVAFGSDVVVIFGAAGRLIVMAKGFVFVCCGDVAESRTRNTGVTLTAVCGIPLSIPPELNCIPFGRGGEPGLRSHVKGGVPPDAVNCTGP